MGRPVETLPNLALAQPGLARHADRRLEPNLVPTLLADPSTRVVDLHRDRVELTEGPNGPALTQRSPRPDDHERLVVFLGQDDGGAGDDGDTAYLAVVEPDAEPTDHPEWRTLRQCGADLADRDATLFATALALANWHATHSHCPRCGAATEPSQGGWLRVCPRDDSQHYPRTDVAVIMSVVDEQDRLLLARGADWGEGRFSVLAGFLEPGESLAAAVTREVYEEVGIVVRDVEYLGDQPWPFPNSLMVGFTARADASELHLQDAEIAEARWFTREEYREVLASGRVSRSTRLSIARRLIERWLGHGLDEQPAPV
ncbi:MAG TPA: NAD(+) diphosphatase [Pedococcus sp.]|nr:NAD(+) diphosphatase [Pedococcus sp.]